MTKVLQGLKLKGCLEPFWVFGGLVSSGVGFCYRGLKLFLGLLLIVIA